MVTVRWPVSMMLAVLASTAVQAQSSASVQAPPGKVALRIEAQPILGALQAFGKQTGVQVLFRTEEVGTGDLKAPRVFGELSVQEALERLLSGTGLKYEFVNEHAVRISSAKPLSATGLVGSSVAAVVQENQPSAARELSPPQQGNERAFEKEPVQLQEVVVTAQKRAERLQDVPMSVSALSGDALTASQSFRFEDYAGKVPGLTLINFGSLGSQLVIRGITSGSQAINSSVATYIDETPYNTHGLFAVSFASAPNLDTFDMQRIEVLRGPQGTLYGANALGGLLKYVSNAPDTSSFSAEAASSVSSIANGGTGFDVHGMLNVPLAGNLALRVVGYDNYYPGFIDDPSRNLSDINSSHFAGGRASILYEPTPALSLRLSAYYQDRSYQDSSSEDVAPQTFKPLVGSLIQARLIAQPGYTRNQVYNLTLTWKSDVATLVSSTSYSTFNLHAITDYSDSYGPVLSAVLGQPYGFGDVFAQKNDTFTQEIRLSSAQNQPWQWQLGTYFTNENDKESESYYPVDVGAKSILYNYPTDVGSTVIPMRYREWAAFGNVAYSFSEQFDLNVGARYSHNAQHFQQSADGLFYGSTQIQTESSEGVTTFSVGPRWHFAPDQMLYARVAKGYVPGGPNDVTISAPVPSSYSSSTTLNYELGVKTSLLDGRLRADLSVFDIDWRQIQLLALVGNFNVVTNGGTARSDGVEWGVDYAASEHLTLNVNGAYTRARLTQDTPASVNGRSGDPLPAVPRWETSAGARYQHPITGKYRAFLAADWRFTGSRYADFLAVGPRQKIPSFNLFDARFGIEASKWSAVIFGKNLGNTAAINYVRPETLGGGSGPQSTTIYPPRTIGLSLTALF